jgi:hypothetical protein
MRNAMLGLILMLLCLSSGVAAQWTAPRGDAANTAFIAGSGALDEAATRWRLPTGVGGSFASALIEGAGDDARVYVAREGAVEAWSIDGRPLWTSSVFGADAIAGSIPSSSAEGGGALVALRTNLGYYLLDGAGDVLASSPSLDPAFGPAAALTLLNGLGWSILATPRSTYRVVAWPTDPVDLSTPMWDTLLDPASASLRVVQGEFRVEGEVDLLVLDFDTVSLLNPADGEVRQTTPTFFSRFGSGLTRVVDLDADGVDELIVAHQTGNGFARLGRMLPGDASWAWLLEYLPADGSARIASVLESVGDVDGDGAPELVASVFNSTASEAGTYPTPPLSDLDGLDLPGRWATLVLDATTGEIEATIEDRLLRGVWYAEAGALLVLADTSSGPSAGELQFARAAGGTVSAVTSDRFLGDVVRGGVAPALDSHHGADATALLATPTSLALLRADGETLAPVEYVLASTDGTTVSFAPFLDAEGGEVAPLRVEPDGRSIWTSPSGYVVRDAELMPVAGPFPGPGRPTDLRGFVEGETAYVAARGAGGGLRLAEVIAGEPIGDVVGVPGALVGPAYLARDADGPVWVVRASDRAALETLSVTGVGGDRARRIATGLPTQSSHFVAALDGTGIVVITLFDGARTGNDRYRLRVFDLEVADTPTADFAPGLTRATGAAPLLWREDGELRILSTTTGQLRVTDDEGTLLGSVANEGLNRPTIVVDVDGDGVRDILAGALAPTPGGVRRFCVYQRPSMTRLWCEADAFAATSPRANAAALPDAAGHDVVLGYDRGEVRRVDGATGTDLWRACVGAGAPVAVAPTPDASPCDQARTTPPVVADIDGDEAPEILFGAADGWVYVISADGALERALAVGSGVSQLAVADIDADGFLEVVATLVAGEIVALDGGTVAAPTGVIDVESDTLTGELGLTDVDVVAVADRAAVRWEHAGDAVGFRVRLRTADGVTLLEREAEASARSMLLDGAALRGGGDYLVLVEAVGDDGSTSEPAASDGFRVELPDSLRVLAFAADPAVVELGASVDLSVAVDAAGPDPIVRVAFLLDGDEVDVVEGIDRLSVTERGSIVLGPPRTTVPGTIMLSVLVTDALGETARAEVPISVVDPVADADDVGLDASDAGDVGPDASDAGDVGPDAGDAADGGADAGVDAADASADAADVGAEVTDGDAGADAADAPADAAEAGTDAGTDGAAEAGVDTSGGGADASGGRDSCAAGGGAGGLPGFLLLGILRWSRRRRAR